MRYKHFTRGILQRHALSISSHPPANSEHPQPTLKGKSKTVNEDGEHGNVNVSPFVVFLRWHLNIMHCQSSENVAPGTSERGNDRSKRRGDLITHKKTSTSRNLLSPAELDNNENWALWKSLFRSRKNDSNKAPAKVTRDSSSEVVDVYPVRYQQVSHCSSYFNLVLTPYAHIRGMSHTSGKIRKSQRLGWRAFKPLQHLKAAQLRQAHLTTVILRTHPHRRKGRQVHHRNLSLDMQVNLYRPMKPVTPMRTRIQTRAYKAPSSSASIRCVFLVDTRRTRTHSTRIMTALFLILSSFAGFFLSAIQCPSSVL